MDNLITTQESDHDHFSRLQEKLGLVFKMEIAHGLLSDLEMTPNTEV